MTFGPRISRRPLAALASLLFAACTGSISSQTTHGSGGSTSTSSSHTTAGSGGSTSSHTTAGSGGSTSTSSSSSGTGGATPCGPARLGCVPSSVRYFGTCGSNACAGYQPEYGILSQTCDATGNWGPSQCDPYEGVCGSGSTSSASSSSGAACTTPCAANEICSNGACTCANACNGACPDLMTDPQNCGACANACASTESCDHGRCVLASTAGLEPFALAIQGSTLYVASPSSGPVVPGNPGRIYAAPIGGGAPTLLYDDPDMSVRALAVDATHVYALDVAKNRVLAIPETGGETPIVLASGFSNAHSMALGGGYAFVATDGGVLEVPLACAATVLVSTDPVGAVVTNATSVYWLDYATSNVAGAPFAGGTPTTLGSAKPCFNWLAADATGIYCMTLDGVVKVPIGGGPLQTLVSGSDAWADLVTDGANLYWLDNAGGVRKASVNGGAATVLASWNALYGYGNGALVLDASYAYWSTGYGVARTLK